MNERADGGWHSSVQVSRELPLPPLAPNKNNKNKKLVVLLLLEDLQGEWFGYFCHSVDVGSSFPRRRWGAQSIHFNAVIDLCCNHTMVLWDITSLSAKCPESPCGFSKERAKKKSLLKWVSKLGMRTDVLCTEQIVQINTRKDLLKKKKVHVVA